MDIEDMTMKKRMRGKTCQNAENKQTFWFDEKIEIEGKTRQNAENKQTNLFAKLINKNMKKDDGCIEYLIKSYFRCA